MRIHASALTCCPCLPNEPNRTKANFQNIMFIWVSELMLYRDIVNLTAKRLGILGATANG